VSGSLQYSWDILTSIGNLMDIGSDVFASLIHCSFLFIYIYIYKVLF